ncbi:MAG TPA: HAD-IB family hydrolase [Solirubrobacteraceae bacterium]|nr:HAD-IB family hydrolase [Solirubrobacteraceae bacterium]
MPAEADPAARVPAAAFFDLDRTLMEGSSAFQFGRAAYRHGLMSRRQLVTDAWANLKFRLRGSSDGDTEALRNRISASLAGTRVRDLERLGADVLAGILPRLEPRVLQIAYAHQDAGLEVYIVTAAAHELAEMLARVLAFEGAIGSNFSEVVNGVYTGTPSGLFIYSTGKATAIRELAEREGFDLAASYAYSDSASDLPMLEAVGHAVVVNPDPALLKTARERGWQVIRVDHLGRRLKTLAAVAGTGGVGGLAALSLASRARRARRRLLDPSRMRWRGRVRGALVRAPGKRPLGPRRITIPPLL